MWVEDFDAFASQSEELFRARPLDTRYCIKYRHCDGKLVLKVTDDVKCLQFKTDQQTDLKKLERVTAMFFQLMATGDLVEGEPMQVDAPAPVAATSKGKKTRRKG
eukprot:gene20333-27093_t